MSWLDYHPLIGPYRESNGIADDASAEADEWPDDRPQSPGDYDPSYEPAYDNGGCKCCGYQGGNPNEACPCCGNFAL